jgi:hypothetical protein
MDCWEARGHKSGNPVPPVERAFGSFAFFTVQSNMIVGP